MALSPSGLLAVDFPHLGGSLQLRLGLVHQSHKSGHGSGWDGSALGLLDDFLWVNVHAIDAEFKMQVRPGGPTGGAHSTNDLTFLHGLTVSHMDTAQVRVQSRVAVAVANFHHIAVAALRSCKSDHTITHGHGGRACWGGIVHTPVRLLGVENGVQAHGKTTGLARKSQWSSEVRPAQAFAVHVVIIAFLPWLLEPDRVILLVVVVEFSAQHPTSSQRFTIGFKHFVNHGKTSAFAQGAVKVNLV